MAHSTSLIATIVVGLVLAFGCGFLASRLRLPPLVGYLLAGIIVGPFTPGFVADLDLAGQLAEIGIILLMFGIGLHFSIEDLLAVYTIALPGALAQIAASMAVCAALAVFWDWSLGAGLLLGLALSVASTVVLLRALEERGVLTGTEGRIAIGWLVVQDLAMVLVLVLLPALAGSPDGDAAAARGPGAAVGITLAQPSARSPHSLPWLWSWASGSCRGSSTKWLGPGHASCSPFRSWRRRSALPMGRQNFSECPSRSEPSSPAWC